jgi:cell wall-associated NlpC family hydrolase
MSELQRITQEKGDELYNSVNKQASAIYFKYLAELFMDTTDEYREFFVEATPVSMKNEGVKNETAPDISEAKTAAVIGYAEKLMGTPYRSSGITPAGFDCSGYVSYVFGECNIKPPHGSQSQAAMGKDIPLEEAQPGDLIFFGSRKGSSYHTNHVGIVHSNNNGQVSFIHSSSSEGVTIDGPQTISWDYWKPRILFVKRIVD